MGTHAFTLGIFIGELPEPDLDRALERVRAIGAEHILIHSLGAEGTIGELSDAQADRLGKRLEAHGVTPVVFGGNVFKEVHLADLDIDTMADHPQFKDHLARLVRGMQIGDRLGFRDVCTFTLAWPGEYTAQGRVSPTWPMRWATRGGIIGSADMDKLEKAFTLMLEQAERYDVNLVLMQMPWNYTNTTGNFRRVAERLASSRIRLMWGPADNVNCGESDTATAGFRNVRPYVHALHMKDLRVNCGPELDFTYCQIGQGHTDYETVLRNLHEHGCPAFLSVASHYVPEGRDRRDPDACEEALRANFRTVSALVEKVTA
ncbi:MAG: sugar phosphate isomerase/epimerase [Spirochaetaceae bacterium]|nr:sugar phosphate isomerase/epimerase [Spirochaetaceae bacterium]